jgi:hypothetical protein
LEKIKPNYEMLAAHIARTLPDSFQDRKVLLATAIKVLPHNCDSRTELAKMLEALKIHERSQLTFTGLLNTNGNGKDGQ